MADEPAIHQYIFAGPKPGLSAEAFQSYWLNVHAVEYAAKIPQIRRYLVATREPLEAPRPVPFFQGVAEIWLQNDEEQIASLQSPEFLHGAREDEPRWAAFWQTFVLDTESRSLKDAERPGMEFVNAYLLVKRNAQVVLEEFSAALRQEVASTVGRPEIRRCTVGTARQSLYGFGEPRFDAIVVWSFDSAPEARASLGGLAPWSFADCRYVFGMIAREHWVIPPGRR